jgi:diguanylate cyclase (GGDEF)-like protein
MATFNPTELLLLAVALQLILFAIGWTVAAAGLDGERMTLRGFVAFNVLAAISLVTIAFRGDDPIAITRTLPNVFILLSMFALAKAALAYWGLSLDRITTGAMVVAIIGVVWFGAVMRDDSVRVTLLLLGVLWIMLVGIWRTHSPTKAEFGDAAANALFVIAVLMLITLVWRVYFILFTDVSADLNHQSRFSELSVFVLMLAGSGPNLLYGYFVCVRLVRSANQVANSDGLTRLLNHRAFMQASEFAWFERRQGRVLGCVLAIDIDHFKQINDRHGHQVGDAVLRMFGSLLRAALPPGSLLGRTGGEEFIAVLPCTGKDEAASHAERLMRIVRRAPWRGSADQSLELTISIGVALDAACDLRANDLLVRADRALYAAKQAGRNRVEFA